MNSWKKISAISSFRDLYSMTHHQPYCYLYLPTIYMYMYMTVLLENLSDKFCAIAPLNKLLSYYLITRLGHCNQYIISMVPDLHVYGQRKTERERVYWGFFQISKSLFSLYRMILMAIAVIALYIYLENLDRANHCR